MGVDPLEGRGFDCQAVAVGGVVGMTFLPVGERVDPVPGEDEQELQLRRQTWLRYQDNLL